MPVLTVREVLSGIAVPNVEGSESVGLIQKRINMPHGKKFTIESIQCFDDNISLATSPARLEEPLTMRCIYVTPYPIVLTKENWGMDTPMLNLTSTPAGGMGPYAGDESVLYKRVDVNANADDLFGNTGFASFEFPNPQSAQDNGYVWYTPHIYLTAIIWSRGGWEIDTKLSFNLKLKITNADSTQCAMGLYKEQLEAQCRTLTETANTIDPVGEAAGRSQPSWLFGGARPEIMISSNNLLRYFNRLASAAYQEMDNIDGFRTRFKEATTMAAFDEPFGDTASNIPNWITLMDVAGVTSGPIRSYPPPVKYSGNGNTVMYDANGLPATVVT